MKVEQIKISDKTEDVIDKLRKINKLFDRQRNLTRQKEHLADFKQHLLKQRNSKGEDSFKDKSGQCRKITQRLRLCNKLHKATT